MTHACTDRGGQPVSLDEGRRALGGLQVLRGDHLALRTDKPPGPAVNLGEAWIGARIGNRGSLASHGRPQYETLIQAAPAVSVRSHATHRSARTKTKFRPQAVCRMVRRRRIGRSRIELHARLITDLDLELAAGRCRGRRPDQANVNLHRPENSTEAITRNPEQRRWQPGRLTAERQGNAIHRRRPHDQTSGPGVVTAASMPARSAAICALVVPVLVVSGLPFVTDAGLHPRRDRHTRHEELVIERRGEAAEHRPPDRRFGIRGGHVHELARERHDHAET